MVTGDIITTSAMILAEIGKIGLWLQAIGLIVIIWFIFVIFTILASRKRLKEIHIIKQDMVRIEKKIDKLLKKS